MEIILSTKKTIKNTFTFDDAVAKEIATSEQTIAVVFSTDLKGGNLVILGVYACFYWFG